MGNKNNKQFPVLIDKISAKFAQQQDPTAELDKVWKMFDKDNNQVLKGDEIESFLLELFKLTHQSEDQPDTDSLNESKKYILSLFDLDHDNTISKFVCY